MLSLLHSNVSRVAFVQTFVTVTSTTQSLLNPGLYFAMHRMLVTRTTWELVFFAAPFLLRYLFFLSVHSYQYLISCRPLSFYSRHHRRSISTTKIHHQQSDRRIRRRHDQT